MVRSTIERRIVDPHSNVLDAGLLQQKPLKGETAPGNAAPRDKEEVEELCIPRSRKYQARDLSRDMAHIIAPKGAADASEHLRVVSLLREKQARALEPSRGQY